MGRELRRVAIDFEWPINKVWGGFLNPLHTADKCTACDGTGYSSEAKHLADQWYGKVPFRPEDRGSVPFKPEDEAVRAFAQRNVTRSPEYYGTSPRAVQIEAERLAAHWNRGWSHHLNEHDVAALINSDRLMDFTHTWTPKTRWQPKVPACTPTPHEVNIWSISGMGHDSINQWVCVKAECARLGVAHECAKCGGEGEIWPSEEAKAAYEAWEQINPPAGEGYQIWETVSEGSPISPVFSTPEDLARHMAGTKWGADDGTPYETWLKFIRGPGWAPSGIYSPSTGYQTGVAAVSRC
jgi:hypothetical protein